MNPGGAGISLIKKNVEMSSTRFPKAVTNDVNPGHSAYSLKTRFLLYMYTPRHALHV